MNPNQQYGAYFPGHPINQFGPTNHPGGHNLNDGEQYNAQNVNYGTNYHFDFSEPGQYRLELLDLAAELSLDWPQQFSSQGPGHVISNPPFGPPNNGPGVPPAASCPYQQSKFTYVKPKNKGKKTDKLQPPNLAPPAPVTPQFYYGTEREQFNNAQSSQDTYSSRDYLPNRTPLQQVFPMPRSPHPCSSDCSSLSSSSSSLPLQSNNAHSRSGQDNFSPFGMGMGSNFSNHNGSFSTAQNDDRDSSKVLNNREMESNLHRPHYGEVVACNNPYQQPQSFFPGANEHIHGRNNINYYQHAM